MVPWYFEHALLWSIPVALAIVIAGALLVTYIGGRMARSQAGERRRALGEPIADLRAEHDDSFETIAGTLEVAEEPCLRYEDGQEAGATTFEVSRMRTWFDAPDLAASSHRRAGKLRIVVGDLHVDVEGPLVVRVGSREYWPGTDIDRTDGGIAHAVQGDGGFDPRGCDGYAVFRSLSHGDAVIARGKLGRKDSATRARGYRSSAMGWRIHRGDTAAIQIAAASPPAFRTRRNLMVAGPAIAVAVGLIAYTALFIEVDEDELVAGCDDACFDRGECTPLVWWMTFGVGVTCRTGGQPQCERMRACAELGRCSEEGGRCVASTHQDCLRTDTCRRSGRCTPRDGVCHVGSHSDCAQSGACRDSGYCTAQLEVEPPMCGVGHDIECERTADCKLRGMCSAVLGRCQAAKPADCLETRFCQEDGLCSFDPQRQLCFAKTDNDCRDSRACKQFNRCYAFADMCQGAPPPER